MQALLLSYLTLLKTTFLFLGLLTTLIIAGLHFFLSWRDNPLVSLGLLIHEVCFSRSHTTTHYSRQDSSGRVISSSQRPLSDKTQHSQQRDIHALGGIRTQDLSRRAAVDLCLRSRDHWDRLVFIQYSIFSYEIYYIISGLLTYFKFHYKT